MQESNSEEPSLESFNNNSPSKQNDFRRISRDDAKEFICWLQEFLGEESDRVWPRADTMQDFVLRRRAVIDAFAKLKDKGFTDRRSGGGFLTPRWTIGEQP